MLKWTSSSSVGTKNNIRYDPEDERTDRPNGEISLPDSHTMATKVNNLTSGKGRPHSFDGSNANRTASLPFSYTDPVASHRPEYPYLTRLDPHNTTKNKTDLSVEKHTDVTLTPNTLSFESHKQSQDNLSRSKSMPRLGSPVSSASSFGGSKKGILAKVKKVFRRSKGEDGERRSVSQPSSPKSGGLSKLRAKSRDKLKNSDVKKSKSSRPEMPLTRLTRRIELRKSQRKKIDSDKETPFAINKPVLNVSDIFHDHFAANKDTEVDLTRDFVDDHYESLFQQHQQIQPTFDTFKSSTPLPCDINSGEAFREVSEPGTISYYDGQIGKRPQYVPPLYQNSNIPQQAQSSPGGQSGTSSSGSVTSHSAFGLCQPRLLEGNVRDSQFENNVRVVGRPRSSYSRISNMSIYEEDNKRRTNKTIANNICDNPTAISQERVCKSCNHENMDSLMQFAEELAETLDTHLDSNDSYHGLKPGISEAEDIHPHIETGMYTERNIIDEMNFQTRMKSCNEDEEMETKVKVEEKDAELTTGSASEIPQAGIIISSDSPEHSDWSEDLTCHASFSEREQNAECYVNASRMYPLFTEADGYTLKSIDILEEALNDRDRPKIDDDFLPMIPVNEDLYKADSNKYQTISNVNEIETQPQNTLSLSSVFTQSSSVSSANSRPFSDSAIGVLKSKEVPFHHKVTNAKNNNNGHSNVLKRKFQFEKENSGISAHSEEKREAKDFEWPEIRKSMHTDCIIGMTRQDHLNPEMQELSMKSINYNPLRVKSIVHRIEEQIKIKLEGYTRTNVNASSSQEINPSGEMVCAKRSLSSSDVNEQLPQMNDTINLKRYDDDDNMISLQVTDYVGEDHTPQDRQAAAASKAGFSSHDIEDKELNLDDISTDVDSLPSASSEVAVISSGGNDHTSRESLGSDTHSICSEGMGGFSSDEAPDFNGVGCGSGPTQEQKDRGDQEEISMSYLADQITKGFEVSSASHSTEKLRDRNHDRKSMCSQCAQYSSPSLPLAAHAAFDFTEEKGITDVTPPCGLVEVNSVDDFAVSNLEQWRLKSGGKGGVGFSQLNQYFEMQADAPKESGLRESKVGANITILKKRDSILSSACKPPSPVKKTVSFKLDKTPTPSTSLSTVSDDAAICEAMSPKQRQRIEEVKQERALSRQISEDSLSDHKVSSDECIAEPSPPCNYDDPSISIVQTNSLSADDLSWWGADCVPNLEFENQTREVEKSRLNAQDARGVNICDRAEVTQIIDEKERSAIVLSNESKYLLESNKTVLSPTIKQSHESPSPEVSTEVGFRGFRKMFQPFEIKKSEPAFIQKEQLPTNNEKDNAKEKNDALREMSESSSNLYTYNISKNPSNVSNDLLFKGPQDDNIDGLAVDIDISSALSDLVDQVESSGLNCSPVPSPPVSNVTYPALEKNKKEKAKGSVQGNVPFWEKSRSNKTSVLRKKDFLPRHLKSREVKPNTTGSIPKKQPLTHGNKNVTEGQNAKPKRKTFRYHLVKSSITKTQMLTAKTNTDYKNATIENRAVEVPKENSNMKETMKQIRGKIELHTKAQLSGAQHAHTEKPSFSFELNVLENREDGEKKHSPKILPQPTAVSTQTRSKIPKSMVTHPLTTSETKTSQESAPINSNIASPSPKGIQKETIERDETCQTQCLERESQNLYKSEPVVEDDQKRFSCSSLQADVLDGVIKSKICSMEPKHFLSFEGGDLIQTILPDSQFNLGDPSDSSSDHQRSDDGDSSNQSFIPPQHIAHAPDSCESATESEDKSLHGSWDDLTYLVHGNDGVRHWQSQDRYGNGSLYIDNYDVSRFRKRHAPLCPCYHRLQSFNHGSKFIHDCEAEAQAQNSHRAPKFQTETRTGPKIDTGTSSSSTVENKSGEWLFIATFFLLQVLLHWLHATNK